MKGRFFYSQPSLLLEFAFFLLLTLAPLFSVAAGRQEASRIVAGALNPSVVSVVVQAGMGAAMCVRSRKLAVMAGIPVEEGEKKPRFAAVGGQVAAFFAVLLLLTANSLVWNEVVRRSGAAAIAVERAGVGNLPLMVAATAVAAFYEEMLYRWYGIRLLDTVLSALPALHGTGNGRCFSPLVAEGCLAAVFALSHGYGGWPAVGNALVAGSLLRLCAAKTGGPFSGFAAHFAYNLIQFSLLT